MMSSLALHLVILPQAVASQRDAETRKYAITSLLSIFEIVTPAAEVDYVLSVQDPTTAAASAAASALAASGAEAKADDDVEIDIDEFGNVVERPTAKVAVKKASARPDWMEITIAGERISSSRSFFFFRWVFCLLSFGFGFGFGFGFLVFFLSDHSLSFLSHF
jgi:hypothetical protein